MRMPLHPAKSQITLPNVLFALSDPTRLQIVKAIAKNENINCSDIQIDLSKSTASRHFRVLREAASSALIHCVARNWTNSFPASSIRYCEQWNRFVHARAPQLK
jgi:predicted transcriptional regulator